MRGARSPAPPPITPLNPPPPITTNTLSAAPLNTPPVTTKTFSTISPTSTSTSTSTTSSLSRQASFLEKWLATIPSSHTVPSSQNQKDIDRHCIFVVPTQPPLPRDHLALHSCDCIPTHSIEQHEHERDYEHKHLQHHHQH